MADGTLPLSASLKEQKEAFVTGHDGTTPVELLLVSLAAPIGVWLLSRLPLKSTGRILAEVILLLIPMVMVQTNLLYPWAVTFVGIESLVALWLAYTQSSLATDAATGRLPSLTCYRASMIMMTCVAILAVDFQIFPRRFAKTEVMGYGLMDLGAGSFVVAAGLLPSKQASQHLKRILPLLGLGLIRFVGNKGVDYQEHMSEYGIHWNFFLTLAVVTPLASFLSSRVAPGYSWTLPIPLMGCYQYALNVGLQDYIETAPRESASGVVCNLFVANREGILGCVGYVSLYLASQSIGRVCLWDAPDQRRTRLLGMAAVLWMLHALLARYVTVSRRSTNATFCVWTLAHNVLLLALFDMVTVRAPLVMDAINRHGLLIFMVANLLTGLVNLSVNTLQVGDTKALAILLTYVCAVAAIALIVDSKLLPPKEVKGE